MALFQRRLKTAHSAYANPRLAVSDPLDEIVRGSLYELFEADLHLQEHPELGRSL